MVERAWAWSLHESIPSNVDAGHKLIDQLMTALTEFGWDGSDLFHLQMAAEEAMVNAVKHGNKGADDKRIDVEFKVSPQWAALRFQDEGDGFCPADLPDPRDEEHLHCTNGRGVMLIQEMMDEVHYNARGNEVTMYKARTPPAETST